ncbi:MAG: DUF3365 domain-containing protein [Eggerthellaceae bacterium]|nr:DUF3365 domain-containing protein [Eggerthellaceae bacterium]
MTLKIKIIGALAFMMCLLFAGNTLWNYANQKQAMELQLLEESRSLKTMMNSVWSFAAINRELVNTSSSGEYDYKGLHCSIVGKSVGVIFSRSSDYTFRFVNFNPRNPADAPDPIEADALDIFSSDQAALEYYRFVDVEGERFFRYVYKLTVTTDCIECHGQPVGETDISGYPKEGWAIGDIAGVGSITVPAQAYYENLTRNIRVDSLFFAAVVTAVVVGLYFALTRLVISPLNTMQEAFRKVGQGDLKARHDHPVIAAFSSREISSMIYSFNNMADDLAALYAGLETQVEQRTEELNRANLDLAQQKRHVEAVNEQLKKESGFKSDFLALVSHELRTPLTSILAFAELLDESLGEYDKGSRRQLKKIIESGGSLLELVNNLLDSARIEAGKQTISPEMIDLYDLLNGTATIMSPLAHKNKVMLSVDLAKNIPLVMTDPRLLERAIENLLSNALKFTPPGGTVVVSASLSEPAQTVLISVADDGIGIPEERQEVVFERFIHSDPPIVGYNYRGSGLGLSLVREIAQLLNARIGLESKPGEGSCFTITIPITAEQGNTSYKEPDNEQDNGDRR